MKELDITGGRIPGKILIFVLPLAATGMLQQLFNSADTAVVGRFAQDGNALAAVGGVAPVVNLAITVFLGLATGVNAVIARLIGEGRTDRTVKAVNASLVLGLVTGLLVLVLGEIFSPVLLKIMSTPEEIFDLALKYLRIYFIGAPFLMIYNFEAGVLRACGDSRRPLYCLILTGGLNVGFNLLFVIVFKMNVEGVAIATLIADIVSAFLLFGILVKNKGNVYLEPGKIKWKKDISSDMLRIGIPSALQGILFSISNIIIQIGLNRLGADYVAGSAVGLNYEMLAFYMVNAFGQGAVTFVGQNYGAGKYKRCDISMWSAMTLAVACTEAMCLVFVVFSSFFAGIYTKDPVILEIAMRKMRITVILCAVNGIVETVSGALRGLGYSFLPTVLAVVFICGLRIVWVYTVFASISTFESLMAVYPVSWGITAASLIISWLIVRKKWFGEK